MPQPSPERIVPPTRLLVSGRQDSKYMTRLFARRSKGTSDWLLIFTEAGQACFHTSSGIFHARGGDVLLFHPDTPQHYGIDESHGYWKNTWTHFLPRPGCLDWMQWPELSPGLMHLHIDHPMREQVLGELAIMDAAAHSTGARQEELAVNALERALLLCDTVNPRHANGVRDARIRKAIDLICNRFVERFTLDGLARQCGLSRSRLAELFSRQVGMPPLAFLEDHRLRRARELLEHTSSTLEEIAGQSGFSSAFYLSLRFKKHFGISPREYRRRRSSEGKGTRGATGLKLRSRRLKKRV